MYTPTTTSRRAKRRESAKVTELWLQWRCAAVVVDVDAVAGVVGRKGERKRGGSGEGVGWDRGIVGSWVSDAMVWYCAGIVLCCILLYCIVLYCGSYLVL